MNPVVKTIFAADPAAHVFDGRVYIYVSYDEPYTNSHDSMVCYHALSTDDMQNWIDHGRILHLENVPWAISHMWAIDCNYWQGKYYLVFCAIERETSTFRTGLAVSDRPEGPFTDLGPIDGVDWGQDPSLFIDGDTPYLLWGARGSILIGRLNLDLKAVVPESVRNLTADIHGYEGPFLHKYNATYYLTFPALVGQTWPQRMCYATAKDPLGPYQYKGAYIDQYRGHSGTIHGSVVEYRGQWYAFYHSGWGTGSESCRSLMLDHLYYDAAGNILPITPSLEGAVPGEGTTVQILQADVALGAGGQLHGATVATTRLGFTGSGYVTGLTRQEFGVTVLAQSGPALDYQISIRYCSEDEDRMNRVMIGRHLFYDGRQNQTYEDYINRGTLFPATHGQWQEIVIGQTHLQPGDHPIRVSASHTLGDGEAGIEIDYIKVAPLGVPNIWYQN